MKFAEFVCITDTCITERREISIYAHAFLSYRKKCDWNVRIYCMQEKAQVMRSTG